MRRLIVALCAAAVLASGGRASAAICTADDVPGATLLTPYIEIGTDGNNSPNTILTIGNASATAVLAHVVIWSDASVHVLDFNVYLTGYDVQNINLEGLILKGVQARTASDGQDPTDTISPQGLFSQDINFASCTGILPLPSLPANYQAHTIASLTGKPDPFTNNTLCAGYPYGDNIMRGYVTIDTVSNCTLRAPGDPGYFIAGGGGDATNQNVLWGSVTYVNKNAGKAYAQPMVHIEASPTDPETSVPGEYTFYGRYTAWTAADNREPLATSFAARYVQGSGAGAVMGPQYFTQGSSYVVWRDSKVNQGNFNCNTGPSWFPLGQEAIVIFDDQEHPVVPQSSPFSPVPPQQGLIPFPLETQKVKVGGAALPTPYGQGWMYLDLNTTVAAAGANPPEDPLAAQAWVETIQDNAAPSWRVAYRATKLDSACNALHFSPGGP